MTHQAVVVLIVRCNLVPNSLCVAESVREAVGRRVKLTLRRRVQLEVKGDKVENRVLVSDSCSVRLYSVNLNTRQVKSVLFGFHSLKCK